MAYSFTEKKRLRKTFGKRRENAFLAEMPVPHLLTIQLESYREFLQQGVPIKRRRNQGLHAALKSVFPVTSYSGNVTLEYVSYQLEELPFDEKECRTRGMTYAASLRVRTRLLIYDREVRSKAVKDIREQDIFMGEVPLMTETGTFIINGTERVIVSQLHRSPGAFFDHDKGKTHTSGKLLFSARIIPYRGSWLDFEFDHRDCVFARIDRRRKLPATVLLRALGFNNTRILSLFFETQEFSRFGEEFYLSLVPKRLRGSIAGFDIKGIESEVIVSTGQRITTRHIKKLEQAGLSSVIVPIEFVLGQMLAHDIILPDSGRILASANDEITEELLMVLQENDITRFETLYTNDFDKGPYFSNTITIDPSSPSFAGTEARQKRLQIFRRDIIRRIVAESSKKNRASEDIIAAYKRDGARDFITQAEAYPEALQELLTACHRSETQADILKSCLDIEMQRGILDGLYEIYRMMRPGEPPTEDAAKLLFHHLFFTPERYDLSVVGRMKFNRRLGRKEMTGLGILSTEDILDVLYELVAVRSGKSTIDDIDHLGNRRVRCVGEMAEQQFRIGLVRVERSVRERLSLAESENVMPQELVNAKPISAAIREFFGSGQLSQFMDQNNPLSEIAHKRRISALGPGGLTRERAGFEVRDVHPTHYGRLCPIETPEGPNIGLINSLAVYARTNNYGFLETPYRKIKDGYVTGQIVFLSAIEESQHPIAQANAMLDDAGYFIENWWYVVLKMIPI